MTARETTAERLVRLEEQMKFIASAVAPLTEMREDILSFGHRMDKLETSVDAIKPTTAEYAQVRDRVIFAGTLGKWMWSIGKVLLSVAAGFASAYYALTGRPPP